MPEPDAAHRDPAQLLPAELRLSLWRRIDRLLQRGDVLITTEHFQEAMEREFRKLIHVPPPAAVRKAMREMIVMVNEEYPGTYLSLGIKNAVGRYLRDLEKRTAGQPATVLEEARKRIKQMVRDGQTAFFLESIGVEVGSKGVPASVERAIDKIVSGEKLKPTPQVQEQQRRRRATAGGIAITAAAAGEAAEDAPVQAPPPDEKERKEWTDRSQRREDALAEEQMKDAHQHLESYLKQNLLEEGEALTLRELYSIDERLAKGEIDQAEAERLRSEFDAVVRDKVRARLREAVDYAVHYLNAFESLKRLAPSCDDALRFLIQNQDLVMAENEEADMSAVAEQLDEDQETLEALTRIMERKEQEARMLAANLPPYRHVLGQGKVADLAIRDSFVDELRSVGRQELSALLNAAEAEVRNRPAEEIRFLVTLLDRLIQPSPFHRAVRQLKIGHTIARLYRASGDSRSGRRRVQHFVNQRLMRLYPDMPAAEKAAIEKRSQEIMRSIEEERSEDGQSKNELRVYRA